MLKPKNSIALASLLMLLFMSCKKDKKLPANSEDKSIRIETPANEPGYVYVEGRYTGVKAPGTIKLTAGTYRIAVALENSWTYLQKEVQLKTDTTITLLPADKPVSKNWKALWVGLFETKGNSAQGECSTHFTKAELDAGFDFFRWSLQQHFEKYSYGTMKWEVERKDISTPVLLNKESSNWFTVEPHTITTLLPEIQPGGYDCVFVFWREREGNCSFQSNYFGLAWTDPMADVMKTGFVTVKFDAGTDINERINYYKTNDPGVWVHEWLHTVGENFYQNKGIAMPQKAGGFSVHAAEVYQYSFPWMDWYKDFIAGRVPNPSGSPGYLGIGPEALLKCTVRETAVDTNCK